ncbi:ComEA family DNA-binding protein [Sinomonas sp. P10A9]|uniref:ComEA family DNA-binding protein n=1 Tax=Sinomonas puerhi TaxID=3238584 RepID=A0AB39KY77_9MICC
MSVRLAAVVAVLLSATCGAWWWLAGSAGPDVRPVTAVGAAQAHGGTDSASGTQTGMARPTGPGAPPAAGGPTVHVVGAVSAPGVYHLVPGARVYEAIAAAGGATPAADTNRLNLAATVEDGTRIRIPAVGDPEVPESAGTVPTGAAPGGAATGATGGKVDINTATVAELATLPRVGPVLAQRIVDFRTAHGRFAEPEGLDAVSGIGPKMLESILPMVTVR